MKNWNPKMFIDGINYLTKIMPCYLADVEGHKMKNWKTKMFKDGNYHLTKIMPFYLAD